MPDTIALPVPGQIRRHVIKNLEPKTKGEWDLKAASIAGHKELVAQERNSLNTIDLHLTNDAVGVALDIARDWLDSDNGNNVMAGKSMLKFELEFEPDDPREIRHEIKMPKSLAGHFAPKYGSPSPYKDESEVIETDMDRMRWVGSGGHGRVRAEALGFILAKMERLKENPHPATSRAAKKFITTYTEPYEKTQRLINGYLGTGEVEEQEPEILTADDFKAAIRGRGPELVEEPEAKPKRLVVIACGGKKSDAPGKIPAEDRYTGNYFQACRQASEVMDGPTMILSAKYGLIPLTEEIENYNVKMGQPGSVGLGVLSQQVERLGLGDAKVTVLGGQDYVAFARLLWDDLEAPLKGGIGQQLKQLAGIYGGDPVDEPDEHQEPEEKPAGPYPHEWKSGSLRDIPNLPGRYHAGSRVVWFGGKAGKANPQPSNWRRVAVCYTGEGRYDLIDVETSGVLMTCTLASKVHWAPGRSEREFDQWRKENRPEDITPEVEAAEKAPAGGYEVPENFLELAAEGNTDAAKAYWTRRCEQYRKTGK
ncbi:DUF6884 domain-containing protein [Streptomyces sp. NPDC005281]|uniref:DUF6884 domain-containing protein n=1 Tax=Streptomyces sp. NPDC005281 TaxID=3155712 RepID=UPI0033B833F8